MLNITVQPTELIIDNIVSLKITLTNLGNKPCTHVNFRLRLPPQIILLEGSDRVDIAKIDSRQNITHNLRVRPKQIGSWTIGSSSFSYRDSQGQSQHPDPLQLEVKVLTIATASETPAPKTVVTVATTTLPLTEQDQSEIVNAHNIVLRPHDLANSESSEIRHKISLKVENEHVPAPKIFISYAHVDEKYMTRLVSMLKPLEKQGVFQIWHDREITVGNEWYQDIRNAINTCDLALLLVSIDFLNSRFIQEDELPRLLQLRKERGLRLIPIIVRHCTWTSMPFLKDLQALPKDGRPVISFKGAGQPDRIWTEIVRSIEAIAKDFKKTI